MRVVQLSDPHLFADPSERLRGVPTTEPFRAVLDDVAQLPGGFDLMVLTGDLAQAPSPETYRALADLLGEWRPRCRLIPGNHDDPEALRAVFPELTPARGPIVFSLVAAGWRILGLDTHVPGKHGGALAPAQLEWLAEEALRAVSRSAAGRDSVLLFLHHPPVTINSTWLDAMGVEDPEPLGRLVARSPGVKIICCGHVHQEFEGRMDGAAFYTTPSTAFQFRPGDEAIVEAIPPGYRVFELEAVAWSTRVIRLPELTYPPE